jgi:hypothetical protein
MENSENSIKTVYNGIEISYNENRDLWEFELRGRDRTADSLVKAKEFIDKPVVDSKKSFEKIEAFWVGNWHGKYAEKVIVTSRGEDSIWDGPEFWIQGSEGRKKVAAGGLLKINANNIGLINEYTSNESIIKSLNKRNGEIEKSYERIDLPKEEA